MLNSNEIELLHNCRENICARATAKGLAVPSGIDLYNAIVTEENRVKLPKELSNAVYSKGEDIFIWCMLESKKGIELPIQLDDNTKITVNVDVADEGNSVRRILELQLNGEGFLRLEYDSKGKIIRQHNFGSPHKGKCSMQILDSKEFKRASFENIIAELEQKYNVDIRILTSAKDETFCYAIIAGSDNSKCSAITTKEYPSIERLLEELKDVILPEYEKLADSFVKLNSLTHEAKIL